MTALLTLALVGMAAVATVLLVFRNPDVPGRRTTWDDHQLAARRTAAKEREL
ncbi:hypothetical protein [uncultured Deinococcus sp.]|uniref:hypothetical protein n=1 Tax=uncultured Deinococcus sp. TaxID=158789 RepID=UPI0025D6D147|nr:hypothetical protein [uncultured Deinococcus sp.]